MSQTSSLQQDIESFHEFASAAARGASGDLTIDEIYERWRIERFNEDDLKAIKASLDDLKAGIKGLPLEEFRAQFEARNGLHGNR